MDLRHSNTVLSPFIVLLILFSLKIGSCMMRHCSAGYGSQCHLETDLVQLLPVTMPSAKQTQIFVATAARSIFALVGTHTLWLAACLTRRV